MTQISNRKINEIIPKVERGALVFVVGEHHFDLAVDGEIGNVECEVHRIFVLYWNNVVLNVKQFRSLSL